MLIEIGWGGLRTTFRPRDTRYESCAEFLWTERGGFDASPTGIEYRWTMHPTGIPKMISDLTAIHAEYETWRAAEKARLSTET